MNIKSEITKNTLCEIENITGCKLTLGKVIWSIRKCEEMSQIEFADKLGISKQHLCDIEHDRKNISPSLAAMYAERLGYLPGQFIQLALQDMVDRQGLKVIVTIKPKVGKLNLTKIVRDC